MLESRFVNVASLLVVLHCVSIGCCRQNGCAGLNLIYRSVNKIELVTVFLLGVAA